MSSDKEEIVRYSAPVTPELDAAVRKRMRDKGFSSVAEYVRNALRSDLHHARKDRLEQLLLEGLDSGQGTEVTPDYREQRRRELNARLARRKDTG